MSPEEYDILYRDLGEILAVLELGDHARQARARRYLGPALA